MRWFSALGTLLLATTLTGLPLVPDPDSELIPEIVENATLSTELQPPPMDLDVNATKHGIVYLINLYALTNTSDIKDGDEELTNDIVQSAPGILEPIATVLLLVEVDDEEIPVSLDAIAKDLEDEGFTVDKVVKDGETQVIKVDFGDLGDDVPKEDLGVELVKPTNSLKVRKKRAPCLKCKLGNLLGGGGGGYGGGGYGGGGYGGGGYGGGGYGGGHPSYGGGGGGCGGGCGQQGGGTVGVIPVVVVPVQGGGGYGGGGGGHRHHQGGGGGGGGRCDVCQGGGGGGGGRGGGGSWSQSSAQASAQSSSGSW